MNFTNNLIKIQSKGLKILRHISTCEKVLVLLGGFLQKAKETDFDTSGLEHRIEIYNMVIKRLFERYETNQKLIK